MEDSKLKEYKKIDVLVCKTKIGDKRAFRELYEKFSPLRISVKNLHYDTRWDRRTLEGLISDFFNEGIVEWNPKEYGHFSGYIKAFVLWKTYNAHKHNKKVNWKIDFDSSNLEEIEISAFRRSMDAREVVIDLGKLKKLKEFFDISRGKLTKFQQQIIELYYYKDFTEKEIAKKKRCSQPLINKLRRRALSKMKREISYNPWLRDEIYDYMEELDIEKEPPKEIVFYSCPNCDNCGFCDTYKMWIKKWKNMNLEFSHKQVTDRRKMKRVEKFPCLKVVNGVGSERIWKEKMPIESNVKKALFEKISK